MASKLYTVSEMASELDVYPETIRKYIKSFKFVGLFKNMGGKSNVLVYPETEFEMIRDTIEGNKVIEKNYYTTQQVAELAGCSDAHVANLASRYHIYKITQPTLNGKRAYYPKESAEKIIEIMCTAREKRLEAAKKKAEQTKAENEASAELHPLVTDKRCLNLRYWPDITPKCFADLED